LCFFEGKNGFACAALGARTEPTFDQLYLSAQFGGYTALRFKVAVKTCAISVLQTTPQSGNIYSFFL
jgi:hypothetical protein